MAKVITLSRKFPVYHPKAGQPTFFVEKALNYTWDNIEAQGFTGCGFDDLLQFLNPDLPYRTLIDLNDSCDGELRDVKHQTVREGKRWKTGDLASLRVWGTDVNPKSGKSGPYHSKQIIIAPDIPVIVYDLEIEVIKMKKLYGRNLYISVKIDDKHYWCNVESMLTCNLLALAKNDGLELDDFKAWFRYPKQFSGQIICWNPNIKY